MCARNSTRLSGAECEKQHHGESSSRIFSNVLVGYAEHLSQVVLELLDRFLVRLNFLFRHELVIDGAVLGNREYLNESWRSGLNSNSRKTS